MTTDDIRGAGTGIGSEEDNQLLFLPCGEAQTPLKKIRQKTPLKRIAGTHQVNTKSQKTWFQTEYSRWHVMDRAAMMAKNQKNQYQNHIQSLKLKVYLKVYLKPSESGPKSEI